MQKNKLQKGEIILPSPLLDPKPCPIITDPQGAYTGRPLEQYEQPVQDVDDL